MHIFDRDFREILASQVVSQLGGLIAGTFLAVYKDKLFLIPAMFILLPGLLEMRGNISGSFASRLSSGLFLHIVHPHKYNTKIIRGNLVASFILAVVVSFLLGVFASLFTYIFFHIFYWKIIFLAVVAGILANIIEIPLTLYATLYFFRKGHDPNNIIGPLVTSTGDITSVVALLIALALL